MPVYDAFASEPETDLKLCRPCGAGDRATPVHGCDGPPCECPICRVLVPLIQELTEDWDWRDRAKSWPSD